VNTGLTQYYRCPDRFERFELKGQHPQTKGYFRFGQDSICYGNYQQQRGSLKCIEELHDALSEVEINDGIVYLPFQPAQIATNLGHEAYVEEWRQGPGSAVSNLYYLFRPVLPVGVRRHLQKMHLRGWDKIAFPRWPVDCSVNSLFEQLLLLALRARGEACIPFIWFWPNAHSSCAVMTHDVETTVGFNFCAELMDTDEAFDIKASFQIVPEDRYRIDHGRLDEIRRRGFEICVHDLNHDGHLYRNREQFLERAVKINAYGRELGAEGFRAGVLYRKQLWYDALQFSFDMSVPNVAHLDPQHGGCCTVMPYFINGILEIPVTTIQDYTLFHILHDYSINLWRQQTKTILSKHGLMSFIIHPDYVRDSKGHQVYRELLAYLTSLRQDHDIWIAKPGEINRWWRQRAAMQLVEDNNGWHIEGAGSEQARVAYATEIDGRLATSFEVQGRCTTAAN
jgi:hypothetical protein